MESCYRQGSTVVWSDDESISSELIKTSFTEGMRSETAKNIPEGSELQVAAQKKRKRSDCEHGRQKTHCKECGGGSICGHGRIKSQCKQCGGVSICEHGRIKSKCKECGGASICQHGRQKSRCKECGGACICQHDRLKYRCKECKALLAPVPPN